MAREGFEDYKMLDVYQDLHEHIFFWIRFAIVVYMILYTR